MLISWSAKDNDDTGAAKPKIDTLKYKKIKNPITDRRTIENDLM